MTGRAESPPFAGSPIEIRVAADRFALHGLCFGPYRLHHTEMLDTGRHQRCRCFSEAAGRGRLCKECTRDHEWPRSASSVGTSWSRFPVGLKPRIRRYRPTSQAARYSPARSRTFHARRNSGRCFGRVGASVAGIDFSPAACRSAVSPANLTGFVENCSMAAVVTGSSPERVLDDPGRFRIVVAVSMPTLAALQ
jgi:hypothetical protein